MLDFDLAELYGVETRTLNQSVQRNVSRFPGDFMFRLTAEEWASMSSQFVMTSMNKRPRSALPFAFTEQGIAMLSSVLRSKVAVQVNIGIMRSFVFMRRYALTHQELTDRLKELEGKFNTVYEALNYLLTKQQAQAAEQDTRRRIGF